MRKNGVKMKLRDLKNSLKKFSGDFYDTEIVLIGKECIALISEEVIKKMEKEGTLKFQKDLE